MHQPVDNLSKDMRKMEFYLYVKMLKRRAMDSEVLVNDAQTLWSAAVVILQADQRISKRNLSYIN